MSGGFVADLALNQVMNSKLIFVLNGLMGTKGSSGSGCCLDWWRLAERF
jgi:hypothetical protein